MISQWAPYRTILSFLVGTALLAVVPVPLAAAAVDLSVIERQGVGRRGEPVTFGVPLPEGALRSAEQVRLLRDGKEVPTQFRATGLWYPDRSIRWLLVDFQTDIEAGSRQDYILEHSDGVAPRAKPPASIRIAESDDAFSVDTGSASFRIGKRAFDLFEEVRLGDGTVVVPTFDNKQTCYELFRPGR